MTLDPQIVVVDDEDASRRAMALALERAGWRVRDFADAEPALAWIAEHSSVRLVVSDLRMPGTSGLELLEQLRARGPAPAVVVVTAFGSIESAVEAMRAGADDYLTKPVDLFELRQRVQNLLERAELREEVVQLKERLDKRYGLESLVGTSPQMERLYEKIRLVAPTRSTVLVTGESGTGKELVANALHQNSPRRARRFVPINCGAIPRDILESELFGHERGAFTGAVARKIGKIELAAGGTLFLDEIGELPGELQVKLLRVLEDRRVMRVGGEELIEVDFRLVAATNRDLARLVEEGKFREDLYYRLKVVTLAIPPLRERRDDIPALVHHLLGDLAAQHGSKVRSVSPAALAALKDHPWQGNVRELRNVLESMVVFASGDTLDVRDLPPEVRDPLPRAGTSVAATTAGAPSTMAEIERDAILRALAATGGHREKAAQMLGIGLRTLHRKLKEYKAG